MDIHVNGERRSVDDGSTVADLIAELGLKGRIAVELNGEIVPRSEYRARLFSAGDNIEIVHAIGGGGL
jgi:thiazole synthase